MITALAVAATISVAAVVVYVATDHELRSGIDQSLQRRADDLDTVLLNPPTPPLAPANATGSSAIGPTIAPPLSGGGAISRTRT